MYVDKPSLRKLLLIVVRCVYRPPRAPKTLGKHLRPLLKGRAFWQGTIVASRGVNDVLELDKTFRVEVPRMRESNPSEMLSNLRRH